MADAVTSYPFATLAVMVHKLFAERVKDYLLIPPNDIDWNILKHSPQKQKEKQNITTLTPKKRPIDEETPGLERQAELIDTSHPNVTLIDSTEKTGVSHDRRGYFLLLVEDVKRPIYKVSPMARQNISWAAPISHHFSFRLDRAENNGTISEEITNMELHKGKKKDSGSTIHLPASKIQDLAGQIWKTLPTDNIPLIQSATSSSNQGSLRVDVYPRNLAEQICLGLQQACHRDKSLQASEEGPTDPFGGPVAMTMSASKCSHRLTIILSESPQNTDENTNHSNQSTYNLYWGLMCRETDKSIMEMKLNHQANEEINVVAPDPETGGEVKPNIPTETPLSRAYYKLDQVWNDYLEPGRKTLDAIRRLEEASAVDFGSAPGGWTQVIAHRVPGLKTVCSVDRGIVAERVTKLPNVKHIHGIIDDCQAYIEPYGPFAIVTCDASKLWSDVMDWFTKIVVHKALQSNNDDNAKPKFSLPCIFVITMKLPFKTLKSVQRHVELIHNKLRNYLSDMVAAMYPDSLEPIQTRSVVAHLMANSDGERTIIVIFERSREEES